MSQPNSRSKRTQQILSRDEIEDLIATGRHIFILNDKVIRADTWLPYHPGGDKIIRHVVGKDATDEVKALHSRDALARMSTYQIGRIDYPWENFLPPIQGGKFRHMSEIKKESAGSDDASPATTTSPVPLAQNEVPQSPVPQDMRSPLEAASDDIPDQRAPIMEVWTGDEKAFDLSNYPTLDAETQTDIVEKYRQLEKRVDAAGLYKCNYKMYAVEASRYITLFGLCLFFLSKGWIIPSAVSLGLFWHQLVFTAHDAGHMGITHNYYIDTAIGVFVADFLGGLSIGWWKRSHNIHHVVTNSPEHDPDVELMPFFALSHRFFDSLYSTFYDRTMDYDAVSKVAVRYQHWLYYPILTMGRFNLYRLSWEHIIFGYGPKKGVGSWTRWAELAGQIFFWTWFGYGMLWCSIPTWTSRVVFVLISHMTTAPLHVQITLSHYAMSTADAGVAESFPQRMLRTTMDVQCPEWLDFIHGGLQFQAIHHLFPRMPRHNLRKAQVMVQNFCIDSGIPYALHGFVDGNKKVIGRLGDVGRQASILAKCQQAIATKPLAHHH